MDKELQGKIDKLVIEVKNKLNFRLADKDENNCAGCNYSDFRKMCFECRCAGKLIFLVSPKTVCDAFEE